MSKGVIKQLFFLQFVGFCLLGLNCNNFSDDKVVADIDNKKGSSISRSEIIVSNELNSPLFSTKGLLINKIDALPVVVRRFKGVNKYELAYKFQIPVKHVFYVKSDFETSIKIPENYIEISGERFLFSSIYNNKAKSNEIRPEVSRILSITTEKRNHYLVVFAKDMAYNNAFLNELVFLFQIDSKKVAKFFFLNDTMFVTERMFGDYNQNGQLDFVLANEDFDTISCKEIIGNQASILKDRFLCIKDTDGIGMAFKIDSMRKSNWSVE